nr:hypothetical protein [Clostridia bacterium]
MNKRMDRTKLNIGTYFLHDYARSEAHIKELHDCGIDFVVCMQNDRAALDLFAKYGIGAVVTGIVPGWWGGNGDNASQMEKNNPIEAYIKAAQSFTDHPAVWGIDAGDEPSALDFPHYGKVIAAMEKAFENQFAYLNLYPNYASVVQNNAVETVNQLGTATYDEHIKRYCECVPADYICYDFYPCNVPKLVLQHYQNLRIVADACRDTGRSMWIVLQVNSRSKDLFLTTDQLRYQAFSSMAFGAENIIWACWTAGWWHNQVLDENGNKTEQYDKLRTVNAEIKALADEYMKYRRTSTHFIGFENVPGFDIVGYDTVNSLDTGVFHDVKSDAPIIVGEMASRKIGGGNALFVYASDNMDDKAEKKTVTVTFKALREVSAVGCEVTRDGDTYIVKLPSNGAALITA